MDRLELSLDLFDALATRVALYQPQWRGFGLALQSYQTRALELIVHIAAMARRHKIKLMCRLVKGAYWDAEVIRDVIGTSLLTSSAVGAPPTWVCPQTSQT